MADEFIHRNYLIKQLYLETDISLTSAVIQTIQTMPAADVQPKATCRMIPFKPDCRGYTDVFICTNCQLHIHLGFISKNYGGNFCLECGAEVKDGE